MKHEIADIYYNSSRISTLDKARQYTRDIETMYNALLEYEDKINTLSRELELYSTDTNATATIQEILKVLQNNGYTTSQPSAASMIGAIK